MPAAPVGSELPVVGKHALQSVGFIVQTAHVSTVPTAEVSDWILRTVVYQRIPWILEESPFTLTGRNCSKSNLMGCGDCACGVNRVGGIEGLAADTQVKAAAGIAETGEDGKQHTSPQHIQQHPSTYFNKQHSRS